MSTKKEALQEMRERIKTDDGWAIGALLRVYSLQTIEEQAGHQTIKQNGIGFNGLDAEFGSSLAEQYLSRGWLTQPQCQAARKMMAKYAAQVLDVGGCECKSNEPPPLPPTKSKRTKEGGRVLPPFYANRMKDGSLVVGLKFAYNPAMKDKVKAISGCRPVFVDGKFKYWTVPLSMSAVAAIKELGFEFGDELLAWVKKEEAYEQKACDTTNIPGLGITLYPFQAEAVEFIERKRGRALMAHEMGLGKTFMPLAWLQMRQDIKRAVFVVPASMKGHWSHKVRMAMVKPQPEVLVLSGKTVYSEITKAMKTARIIIINYDILDAWQKAITTHFRPQCVVFDECHFIKNQQAKRTRGSKRLCHNVPHIIGLSGTPIVNRPIEIYTIVNLLCPSDFPSRFRYGKEFCGGKHNGYGWDFSGATNTARLHKLLVETCMLRRLKKDVLKDLPDKARCVIPLDISNRAQYTRAEADFLAYCRDVEPERLSGAQNAEALAKIARLRQLAVEGKLDEVYEWIDNFMESGEKLVVFCHHKSVVNQLMERYGHMAVKVDGSTPVSQRTGPGSIEERFQLDDSIRLFVGNMKAAGVGLTLTAASNTCFVELGWTPGDMDQCEDRIHRIGQKRGCMAWYLMAEATIETELASLIDHKRGVLSAVHDGKDADEGSMLKELLRAYKERTAA